MDWHIFYHLHSIGGTKTKELVQFLSEKLNLQKIGCGGERISPKLGGFDLSYVDLVIADRQSKRAEILCEIEEKGNRPKDIIGDLLNPHFSEEINLNDDTYRYENPHIWVGIVEPAEVWVRGRAEKLVDKINEEIHGSQFEIFLGEDMSELRKDIVDRTKQIIR